MVCSTCHSPFTTGKTPNMNVEWAEISSVKGLACSQCRALKTAIDHFLSDRSVANNSKTRLIIAPDLESNSDFVFCLRAYSNDNYEAIRRYEASEARWDDSHFGADPYRNVMRTGGFNDYDDLGSVEFYEVDGKTLSVGFAPLIDCKETSNSAIDSLGGRSNDYKRPYIRRSLDREKRVLNPLLKPLLPRRRHIYGDTSSEAAIAITKKWLKSCCCQTASPSAAPLPKRTIYVGESNEEIRLVENDENYVGTSYVSLSHCWGTFEPLQTTKRTLEDRKRGISFESLPRTFQDVIDFTRRLDIRHVWIDSLCIVQDDEDDWAIEASKMAEIYSKSTLTIAAAIARDAREGCYRKHDAAGVNHQPLELKLRGLLGVPRRIFARRKVHSWDESLPLTSRAWILQEQVLSRRVLYFYHSELIWQCNEFTSCQCGAESFPLDPKFSIRREEVSDQRQQLEQWMNIVEKYTRRQLTERTDRLPALSGTARRFQEYSSDVHVRPTDLPLGRYLAGLWERYVIEMLAWRRDIRHPNNGYDEDIDLLKEQQPYHAPSWSWASLDWAVRFDTDRKFWTDKYDNCEEAKLDDYRFHAELVDVELSKYSSDQFGRLRDAYLTLRTVLLPGIIVPKSDFIGDAYLNALIPEGEVETTSISSLNFQSDGGLGMATRDVVFRLLWARLPKPVPVPTTKGPSLLRPFPSSYIVTCLVLEKDSDCDHSWRRIGLIQHMCAREEQELFLRLIRDSPSTTIRIN